MPAVPASDYDHHHQPQSLSFHKQFDPTSIHIAGIKNKPAATSRIFSGASEACLISG
jgi:hypothetical protein